MLTNWKSIDVAVYIHVFSLNMSSKPLFIKAQKTLIDPQSRDRSGAASQSLLMALMDRLKDIHKFRYSGAEVHWQLWANAILAAKPEQQERLVFEPPPGQILSLFRLAPDHPDDVLRGVQQNVCIGKNVNNNIKAGIAGLRDSVDQLKNGFKELQLSVQDLDRRLELLESTVDANENILTGVEKAMHVEENEVSTAAYNQVEYLEDPDHIF